MASETVRQFKEWFWKPPRAHGDVVRDRSVSFLELLYDLVYVAVITLAAEPLAADVSIGRLIEFAIVFSLIWIAWVNGTLYLELHGREDGRTRVFVFVQMGILALLAVFTGIAAEEVGGARFALVYAAFLATLIWLWNSVRRLDTPELAKVTGRYVIGLVATAALILVSAFLPANLRLVAWAIFIAFWILSMLALGLLSRSFSIGVTPTHSMVERFGLFIIIVLGEVVFGVVEGLTHAEQDLLTISTGTLALGIGLGLWWVYFDLGGRREPRAEGRAISTWILTHLPITLAIAAAGAAMVSLIEHAHDPVTPQATAWLLCGSVALVLVAQVVQSRSLEDSRRLDGAYRPVDMAMVVAAVVVAAAAWLPVAPWVLALVLGLILTALWFFAVARLIRAGGWPPPS
ncbi:MAG: low temperature requirement protein A [Chloroflexota bacterium]